jgi:hypothetical protein
MERAIKAITELVLAQLSETQAEKLRATKAQLLSLVGVPQEVIRIIQKLGASRGIVNQKINNIKTNVNQSTNNIKTNF